MENKSRIWETPLQIVTVLGSVVGASWYLSTQLEHRLTAIETAIALGRTTRDAQISDMKDAASEQSQQLADLTRKLDILTCNVIPAQCKHF